MPDIDGPLLQAVLIIFILGGVGFLVWRDRASAPGKVAHDVSGMRQEQAAHGRRLKKLEEAAASAEDVERLNAAMKEQQTRIEKMERQVGSIAETGIATARRVRHIDERQDKMAEDIASTSADVRAASKQIDRIYDVLVQKGMR